MATEEEIREIKKRVNIEEIASQYLKLKKSGKNLRSTCPFHQDSNPSFTISPEKNLFHCFGCGEGGDIFKFLMKIENIDFPEAVRRLAERAGIKLESKGANRGESFKLKQINQKVARYFHKNLLSKNGAKARSYLADRGLTKDIIKKFKLGYALPGWENLLNRITKSKLGTHDQKSTQGSGRRETRPATADLLKLGLIIKGREGGYYDRFRGRLIFPIFDIVDTVIGFAGRSIPGVGKDIKKNVPKYLNIPNTPLFKKGETLYGLNIARQSDSDWLILMEGYTDVIAACQAGFENACAQMGTALTTRQAQTIKRFFDQVIITYDRDMAGQEASLRGMGLLRNAGLEVKVALLPANSDPDDIIQKQGKEGFRKILKKAVPFHRFFLTHLEDTLDLESIEGKEEALSQASGFLKHIESVVFEEKIMKELAWLLDLPYGDVKLKIRKPAVTFQPTKSGEDTEGEDGWGAEDYLLYFLVEGDLKVDRLISEFDPKDFLKYEDIMTAVFELFKSSKEFDFDALMAKLDSNQANVISRLTIIERDFFNNRAKAIEDNLSKLRCARINRDIKKLNEELERAEERGDDKKTDRLFKDRARLQKEMLEEIKGNQGRCANHGP